MSVWLHFWFLVGVEENITCEMCLCEICCDKHPPLPLLVLDFTNDFRQLLYFHGPLDSLVVSLIWG